MSNTNNLVIKITSPAFCKSKIISPAILIIKIISTDNKWNIAGLSEQKIMSHMSEVGIAYQNNHDIDQPDIVNLLVNGFSSTLREWRDSYPTGLPIFATHIGCGILDDLNNTILKYFVGTPSPRVSGLLNILRCSTMTDYRWYQDVFVSWIMLRKDCHKPYWKEMFIDGLPPIFAHKVKQVLIDKNDSLNYDNLIYDDIFSAIKKFGTSMCNNEKLLTYQLQIKKKAKMGNSCKQYGLPPIAHFKQKGKKHDKSHKSYSHKNKKDTKTTLLNLMIFMLKRKMFLKNINTLASLKISLTY